MNLFNCRVKLMELLSHEVWATFTDEHLHVHRLFNKWVISELIKVVLNLLMFNIQTQEKTGWIWSDSTFNWRRVWNPTWNQSYISFSSYFQTESDKWKQFQQRHDIRFISNVSFYWEFHLFHYFFPSLRRYRSVVFRGLNWCKRRRKMETMLWNSTRTFRTGTSKQTRN